MLGRIAVVVDGRERVLGATREAALLADLVVHANEVVPTDRLIDDIWHGRPPPGATSTLHTYVKNLRRLIEPDRSGGLADWDEVLVTRRPGYMLHVDPDGLDVWRSRRLIEEGRAALAAGDAAVAGDRLRFALALWHGPAFGELAGDEYLRSASAELEELRLAATADRVEADLATGRHAELCGELESLIREHPYRERFWGQLMVALYRSGRQADALRAYQRVRTLLGNDLGIEPRADLSDLDSAILRHDPALDAPPAVATPRRRSRPRSLPASPSSFIGRNVEVQTIVASLATSRVVTLVGAGGIGKTRVALEVARQVEADQADGVWVVELASVGDDEGVMAAVATELGVVAVDRDRRDAAFEASLDYLSGRRCLVVLDNCEQVVSAVAHLVEAILHSCPYVRILATSREVLRTTGEAIVALAPLGLPDATASTLDDVRSCEAVELFCDRARNADASFALTEQNARFVASICRRLDGIPLAIELAAARTLLSLAEIDAQLGQSFALLRGGSRTASPRQQTLQAALDWSFEMLSDAQRRAFASLSVFPDRFTLDAAVEVATEGNDTDRIECIEQLVDKSLVEVDRSSGVPYLRLLQPIRQYASAQLEPGGSDALQSRHCEYYVRLAEKWFEDLPETRLLTVRRDWPNLVAALDWSLAAGDIEAALRLSPHQDYSRILGLPLLEVRRRLERTVSETDTTTRPQAAKALVMLASIVRESSEPDPDRVEALVREALDRTRDPSESAWVRHAAAEVMLARGHLSEARSLDEDALAYYEAHGRQASQGWCHERLGWVSIAQGDPERGRQHFEQAAALAHASGDSWLEPHALAALGPLRVLSGDRVGGQQVAAAAVEAARRLGVESLVIATLVRATETALLAGDHNHAGTLAAESIAILRDQPIRRWAADALEIAALIMVDRDDDRAARVVLAAANAVRLASRETAGGSRTLAGRLDYERRRLGITDGLSDDSPSALERAFEAIRNLAHDQ